MIYLTRKEHFSAAHRLHNPAWPEEKNRTVYGKCNNANGHGHNYILEVTVAGVSAGASGMVFDLKALSDVMRAAVIDRVDHKHLNLDVDVLRDIIPTAENLAIAFWQILEKNLPKGTLYSVKLHESDRNAAEYRRG